MRMEQRLFACGRLMVTKGLKAKLTEEGLTLLHLIEYLNKHTKGDFGILGDGDKRLNREAIEYGERILSKYEIDGITFYIITEADRSVTTFLLPSEY